MSDVIWLRDAQIPVLASTDASRRWRREGRYAHPERKQRALRLAATPTRRAPQGLAKKLV